MEAPVPPSLESRIAVQARRDRVLAITFTLLMWLVLAFLFVTASAVAPHPSIIAVLAVATLLLGLFNTASVLALLRRYAENRELIYRPDVLILDRLHAERERRLT
jgi:membrane protein YdbS with pleckstrin-like domain